jgi:hypothetical protein
MTGKRKLKIYLDSGFDQSLKLPSAEDQDDWQVIDAVLPKHRL